jgi:predicted metalloprotease
VISGRPDAPVIGRTEIIVSSFRKALAAVVSTFVLSGAFVGALGSQRVEAMSPAQGTSLGTAQVLTPDLDAFWRAAFQSWGWSTYYRPITVHPFVSSVTVCGGKQLSPFTSFACRGAYIGNIWFAQFHTQYLLNVYGDYGAGIVLAHEWGHEIMYDVGWTSRTGQIGEELFADCLAGMYTRYGVTVTHRLDGSDYSEGYRALASAADETHGTAQQRTDWYSYGYSAYNIYSCARALG